MPKRETNKLPLWSKLATIPLLPAIILLWMIGWTLITIGTQQTNMQTQNMTLKQTTTQNYKYSNIPKERKQPIPEIAA